MRFVPRRHGVIAPSDNVLPWSEISKPESITSCVPKPWQAGHAPRWLLKEKCLGVSSPKLKPVSASPYSAEYRYSDHSSHSTLDVACWAFGVFEFWHNTTMRLPPH